MSHQLLQCGVFLLKFDHFACCSEEILERSILEKLAASHAFAQSAKLSSFAESVQKSIEDTRGLAEELAYRGEIVSQSQRDIARNLGRLILDRHTIYLYADVISCFIQHNPSLTLDVETVRVGNLHCVCNRAAHKALLTNGQVLDTPDVCWENPDLDPLYRKVNTFLELKPRVDLLNSRVEVVRELLRCTCTAIAARVTVDGIATAWQEFAVLVRKRTC